LGISIRLYSKDKHILPSVSALVLTLVLQDRWRAPFLSAHVLSIL
jgi:hypothetical protein